MFWQKRKKFNFTLAFNKTETILCTYKLMKFINHFIFMIVMIIYDNLKK